MKNAKTKNYATAVAMAGLFLAGASAKAQGTYGGGRGIMINGMPQLIDAHMNCDWNTVYSQAKTLSKFDAMMKALETVHPIMAIETKAEMKKIPVCMANGTYFKKIALNFGPDFMLMKPFASGPQLAVRWFIDSNQYPDEVYVDSKQFALLPENQKAELMFHEIFHSFVPRDGSDGRDLKISSLGNSMLKLLNGTLTREELEMQLTQARVSMFSAEVDPIVEQYKTEITRLVDYALLKEKASTVMKAEAILAWKTISNDMKTIRESFSPSVNSLLSIAEARIFGGADQAIKLADLDQLQAQLDQGIPANDANHDLLSAAVTTMNEKAILMILDHPNTVLGKNKDQQLNRVVELGLKNRNTLIPVLRYLGQIDKVSESVAITALAKNTPAVIQVILEKPATSTLLVNQMARWVAKHPGALLDKTESMVLDSSKTISELNAMGAALALDAFIAGNESAFTKVLGKIANSNASLDLQENTLLLEMVRSNQLLNDPAKLVYLTKLMARADLDVNQTNAAGEIAFQIAVDHQSFHVAGEIARHSSFDYALVPKWLKDSKRTWKQNKEVLLAAVSEVNVGMLGALAKSKYFTRMDWIEVKAIAEIKCPSRTDIFTIIEGELQ